ncbi:hypothetical protein Egran_07152, partial [Elaphomyces granulatus]
MVRSIQESSRIPVLGHAEGICHLYLDAAADPAMAVRLAVDGKCDYPAACNATETILVHEQFVSHVKAVADALIGNGVEIRADSRLKGVIPTAKAATDDDFHTEHGALIAVAHIAAYGSAHTDAICTNDAAAAEHFLNAVDSASVFHNASTRFADGYRYGLGAEVGRTSGERVLERRQALQARENSMSKFDMIVIGSGPGGQRAAVQAAKIGKTVALIEKGKDVGGVSVNTGTLPSKTLREAVLDLSGARERQLYGMVYRDNTVTPDALLSRARRVMQAEREVIRAQLHRNHVKLIHGTAKFTSPTQVEVNGELLDAAYIVIAVGTYPAVPPGLDVDHEM